MSQVFRIIIIIIIIIITNINPININISPTSQQGMKTDDQEISESNDLQDENGLFNLIIDTIILINFIYFLVDEYGEYDDISGEEDSTYFEEEIEEEITNYNDSG